MINKIKTFVHWGLNGSKIYENMQIKHGLLKQELTSIKQELTNTKQELTNTTNLNSELNNKYELSKEQLQVLLTKKTINILELKNWYENKRNQNTWKYNGRRLGFVDVSKYLVPINIKPFTELAIELIKKYKLTSTMSPTEIITAMYKYWNIKSNWTYSTDLQLHSVIEIWEEPSIALKNRRGDCETKAKCMLSTATEMLRILKMSEHEWRLTFVASIVAGEGGHAFLTWLHDDGEYYVIESTFYEHSSKEKTWLQTPMRNNNMYQSPWGFATKTRSWIGRNTALLSFRDPEIKT